MRRWLIVALGLGACAAALAVWFALSARDERRFQAAMSAARDAVRARHYEQARRLLLGISARWPRRGEAELLLGTCEKILGHPEAALKAWQRVPEGAPEAGVAALSLGRLAFDRGQYGLAEAALERAARAPGEMGAEARRQSARLDWQCGKLDEYRQILRAQAEATRDPSTFLRNLWWVDSVAYPIDGMRGELARAQAIAPNDDRVWLAAADVATRSGRFEEASAWLDRCEKARPHDAVVWRARLLWARAADRPDEADRAAAHLAADATPRTRLLGLQAWLAARAGNRPAELEALEALLALDPGDAAALDRLAELNALDGPSERVSEIRREKARVEAARDRYLVLMERQDPLAAADELAAQAETLGRWFDASCWWAVVARRELAIDRHEQARARSRAARQRLAEADAPAGRPGQTLAALLAPLRPPGGWQKAAAIPLTIPTFRDDAATAGLAFTFHNGQSESHHLPETFSGGVGLLDYDGDGWLDVYAVQGGTFPPSDAKPAFGDHLFRNLGNGRFEDVTARSGLAALPGGYGLGVAVGDYDNDGHPDLFVTRWRSYALYHNRGDGTFEDVTARAGLGGDRDWPTSAAWADLDGDGDLDLYVCHYLKWDPVNVPLCDSPLRPGQSSYCHPRMFPALPDHVFRNDGGHFVDVTRQAGMVEHEGRGLGVLAADLDGDGKTDIFVTNDTSSNLFFRNQGGFRFVEEGIESGLATNSSGGYLAGMGVACGDLDGDGRIDVLVTNFFGESTTLYHNLGGGLFGDHSTPTGLTAATRFMLGFGIAAVDANNDGWLDLVQANGHINDYRPTTPYEMPPQLLLGNASGRFADVSERAGACWKVAHVARGLAAGDLDNDGRIDAVMVPENEPLMLLRNYCAEPGHFLTIALEGTTSNRDGVGAKVAVTAGGRTHVAARFGGGSYLSASDARLHFGLGSDRAIDRVEVSWPSGRVDRHEGLQVDTGYRLKEGDPTPRPLIGFEYTLRGRAGAAASRTSRARNSPGP